MKAFYADQFVLPLTPGHRFPMATYQMLRDRLGADYPEVQMDQALHATDEELALMHSPDCVQTITTGNSGLGVVAQGNKHLLLGEEVIKCGPNQSMLTTIELPVISHVTHASTEKPLLGLMLTLDAQEIVQTAADMQQPAPTR